MIGLITTLTVMTLAVFLSLAVVFWHLRPIKLGLPSLVVMGSIIMAIVIYGVIGRPLTLDKPLANRGQEIISEAKFQRVNQARLEMAKRFVADNPSSIEALLLLAESAATARDYDVEINALKQALAITADASIRSILAEALTRKSGGVVTEKAAGLLRDTLNENPDDWRGLYLMGLYAAQSGDDERAISLWHKLGTAAAQARDGEAMLSLVNEQLSAMAHRRGEAPQSLLITREN